MDVLAKKGEILKMMKVTVIGALLLGSFCTVVQMI
jgi:hypothetical protein